MFFYFELIKTSFVTKFITFFHRIFKSKFLVLFWKFPKYIS